ncbi:hypothetical protein CEXT_279341 [Caerostris extrusa]|uniref:Uncharacterized protein n=1 Tax=Caerostris extrusa TaxID=172846 RepID=A0AAV4Y8P9_CAEEX|nr:hypothetical protein CEXT_279341 [Caerostris extrusa]
MEQKDRGFISLIPSLEVAIPLANPKSDFALTNESTTQRFPRAGFPKRLYPPQARPFSTKIRSRALRIARLKG